MANIKEYKIVINGLEESINAVDSLNKQLNALEAKIKALESKTIKVNVVAPTVTSSGTSSKGSSKASMSEEEKLSKQIEQTDAKREAYSKKIYQNYLAAKDVLDKTVKSQKEIAAKERLQADQYSKNTMAGLKEELADIKKVMNTTDIGDDAFKQLSARASEITEKLKKLEEAYGQFGRNVGNYPSAFDALNKVSVTIGGTVKQFDNLKQATKAIRDEMGVLIDQNKEGTVEYKKLESELRRVTKAQQRLNSAMNDAKASSKVMDDLMDTMESFVALGQVGQGFSTLFGLDNSALEQQIAKLVALQNVLSGIEKIRQQMNTGEGIGGWFSDGSKGVDQFVAKLAGAEIRMGKIIGSSKQASIALNGLSTVLKGLGVGAIVGGTIMVINKLNEFSQTAVQAGDASKILGSSVDYTTEKLEKLRKTNVNNYLVGITDELGAANNSTNVFIKSLDTLIDRLKEMNEVPVIKFDSKIASEGLQNGLPTGIPTMLKALESMGIGDKEFKYLNPKPLQEFKKEFISLAKTIESYERPKSGWQKVNNIIESILPDAITPTGQQRKALGAMGSYILGDYIKEIETTMNKAKKEMSTFGYVTDKTKKHIIDLKNEMHDNEALNIIFSNLDKFTRNSEQAQKVIDALKKAYEEFAESVANPKQLDPSRLLQLQIDAMADSEEKIRKQNELNRKKEISDANFNPEYTKAINAKYDRELQENLKAYRKSKKQEADQKKKEERDVQNEIDDYKIQLMKEGLEKETKALENERKQKLQEIADSGIRVQERQSLVWAVYDKKITELQKDWANEMREIYGDLYRDIEKMNNEMIDASLDLQESILNADTSKRKDETSDRGITPQNYDDSKSLEQYYKEILKIEQEAADEENRINQERIKLKKKTDEEEEELRHDKLVREGSGEYAKQLEAGKITLEQYNKLIEEENKVHAKKMQQIEDEYYANSEKSLQDSLDKKKKAYSDYHTSIIAEIRKNQDRISNESSNIDKRQNNAAFGIFNIKDVMKGYDDLISKEKTAVEKIKAERDKLIQDKNNGKIKGEDFLVRMEELDAAENAAMASIEDLEKKQKASLDKFIGAIMATVQLVGQSIQQIMQAVWEAQDYQMEKEFDELDKWNEELDNKLQEQQDIVEKHKNNVDSIEDELATARGDRRQHLIDQLNAEIEAQRAAQREEQRIQREQEKAKKREEALEKKRREQEYKRNVMQAFISWHLSIANGLATQPFLPVGIAMGALATTLGAIQYALVKSQKPYAKGGQLDGGVAQGKRHRDGGIPVLGGRASIEGGEFITNRTTTAKNIDLLEYINSKKKRVDINDLIEFYGTTPRKTIRAIRTKFEDGGYLPTLPNSLDIREQLQNIVVNQDNRPIYVSVVDINNKQEDVRRVQALAGL